jgi:hypothetical protein
MGVSVAGFGGLILASKKAALGCAARPWRKWCVRLAGSNLAQLASHEEILEAYDSRSAGTEGAKKGFFAPLAVSLSRIFQ